jgi:cytoskeletal protein RodZ
MSEENKSENLKITSLGQILKEKREDLKMEIIAVSSYLKIKSRDIEAMENDDFAKLAKHIYAPGLIHSYAKILKLDEKFIEEEIKLLGIQSNVENKKHRLINIGENNDLTPDKDQVFTVLLFSVLLFLTLLSLYNSYDNKTSVITNRDITSEFEKVDLNGQQ